MRRLSSSLHTPASKEKQRRDHMKHLYSTLAALLHLQQPYESKSLPNFLDLATASLTQLKERVERLNAQKERLEKEVNQIEELSNINRRLKVVQVTESMGMYLEVNLIFTVTNNELVPFDVLRVIEQGGVEIMSSSINTVGHHIYCTIHAKAFQARLGFDAKLIESQLMELIY